MLLYGLTSIVTIALSYIGKVDEAKHLHRLTFWTRHDKEKPVPRNCWIKITRRVLKCFCSEKVHLKCHL